MRTRNQSDPGSLLAWDIKKGHVPLPVPACSAWSPSEKPQAVCRGEEELAALQIPLHNSEAPVDPWAGVGPSSLPGLLLGPSASW